MKRHDFILTCFFLLSSAVLGVWSVTLFIGRIIAALAR